MDRRNSEKIEKVELFASVKSISFVQGFLTGFIFANFNKSLLVGFVIGSAAGIYLEQQIPENFPDLRRYFKDLRVRIFKKD